MRAQQQAKYHMYRRCSPTDILKLAQPHEIGIRLVLLIALCH